MAMKMRLARTGRKKAPHYRLVVTERAVQRDGKPVDVLGRYDPRRSPPLVEIDAERAKAWLTKGVETSPTVRRLLKAAGVA